MTIKQKAAKSPAKKSSNKTPTEFFIFLSIIPITDGFVISKILNNIKPNTKFKIEIETRFPINKNVVLCPNNSSITIKPGSFYHKISYDKSYKNQT